VHGAYEWLRETLLLAIPASRARDLRGFLCGFLIPAACRKAGAAVDACRTR